jgi:hypothetical protein
MNSLIEHSTELSRVVVIRIDSHVSQEYYPFINFPEKMKSLLQSDTYSINGGYEYDKTIMINFDVEEVRKIGIFTQMIIISIK